MDREQGAGSREREATPKRWHGRCGCGELGDKVGGIVSCRGCLERDERGGYGMMRIAGLRQKRAQMGEVAA